MLGKLLIEQQPINKGIIALLSLLMIFMVGVLRIKTGPEYALSLLYFFPIIICSWYINAKAGYIIAILCDLSWLAADLTFLDQFSHPLVPVLNEIFRLLVFLAGVSLLSGLKQALIKEKLIAMTDPLTGAFNRRAFEKFARLEMDRFRRYNIPFSVIFFDIDNFKTINDNFGHHTGDRLLKEVSRAVTNNIRSVDTFSRLGGDEFMLILSGANKNVADAGVKKIRTVLESAMFDQGWSVTFSIGVVFFSAPPEDLNQIFTTADETMYHAKQNGKNQDRFHEFAG